MNRLLTWGEAIWPGRWGRWMASDDINLLPWRRLRQGLEWAAWALGLAIGAAMGQLVAHVHLQQREAEAGQWQRQSEGLRQQLQAAHTRIGHWQQRWAWQAQRDEWLAWRAEAFRGLLQPLQAPPGEALFRSMSWDGQQAQAEIWVTHPGLASPWLQAHWTPHAPTHTGWQPMGEWQTVRRESGEVGAIGATVWSNRLQSLPPGRPS